MIWPSVSLDVGAPAGGAADHAADAGEDPVMPPVSEAQRRFMQANKTAPGKLGKAAREYAAADKGGKLPSKVGPKSAPPKRSGRGR